jgi:hypothetical protein
MQSIPNAKGLKGRDRERMIIGAGAPTGFWPLSISQFDR